MKRKRSSGRTSVELPAGGLTKRGDRQLVCLSAMQQYMADPGISVPYVWENCHLDPADDTSPLIKDLIKLNTLQTAANKGKWASRRTAMFSKIEKEIMQRLQSDIVAQRVRELQHMRMVFEVAERHVFGVPDPENPGSMLVNPVKPRSLEGMVRALVALDTHIENKRDRIAGSMTAKSDPDVIDSSEVLPVYDDALTDEELAAYAEQVVRKRAARSRAKLLGQDLDDEEEGEE